MDHVACGRTGTYWIWIYACVRYLSLAAFESAAGIAPLLRSFLAPNLRTPMQAIEPSASLQLALAAQRYCQRRLRDCEAEKSTIRFLRYRLQW